jgi:hypothetical protein
MTTETSSAETTSAETTSQDTQVDTTQISTDQSQEQQQPPSQDQANDQTADEGAQGNAGEGADTNADTNGAGGDGDGQEDGAADPWAGQDLDEETRQFIGDKTPAQVAKELHNAQKLLGKKAVGIPGKDSTPEEHRAFHKARGVPDDAAGYDLTGAMDSLKEVAPEGWAPSAEMETSFRNAARLSNLSQGEATEFAKHYLGEQFKAREQFVATQLKAQKDAKALMATEWGADQEVNQANFARGMKSIGLEGQGVDVLLEAIAGSGAARFNAVNSIAEIGRRFSENGPVPNGHMPDGGAGMTKQQARAEMDRIRKDPVLSSAYNDVTHDRHKEVTAEMTRLGKIERGIS